MARTQTIDFTFWSKDSITSFWWKRHRCPACTSSLIRDSPANAAEQKLRKRPHDHEQNSCCDQHCSLSTPNGLIEAHRSSLRDRTDRWFHVEERIIADHTTNDRLRITAAVWIDLGIQLKPRRTDIQRLCLGVLRTAMGELLSTDDIAGRVIAAKGFNARDTILRGTIREQVGSTVKRLHREAAIDNIGFGRASKWKLAENTVTG